MSKLFLEKGRTMKMDTSSKDAFLSWQNKAKKKLRELLALDSIPSITPSPILIESIEVEEGIIREKWVLETAPDLFMPFYVLIPSTENENTPVYITAPGHLGGGKDALVGIKDNPLVKEKIDFYGYDYALYLAHAGFVSIAFDPVGFGERREKGKEGDENILLSSCYEISHMAESLGLTLCGLLVHEIVALIDMLSCWKRWGEIRCLGFSGGGLQTLYAAAIDERINLSFISGYYYGFYDSLLKLNSNCSCNYIPSLYLYFDIADIAALIAPRALIIQSGKDDHLAGERGIVNVLEPMKELKSVYSLFGKENRLYHQIVPGPHHFEKEGIFEIMEKVCID